MGAVASAVAERRHRNRISADIEMTPELERVITKWSLTPSELHKLHATFTALDVNQNNTIEFQEFFAFADTTRSEFLDPMYTMIVHTQHEHLYFHEWLPAVFSFCLLTPFELKQQVFHCYDTNKTGTWDTDELRWFFVSVHGNNPILSQSIILVMTESNLAHRGQTDFDEFNRAEVCFPMILWPVQRLQDQMRRALLGMPLFHSLDARTDSRDLVLLQRKEARLRWIRRKHAFMLYCCGWPCCRRARNDPEYRRRRQQARYTRKREHERLLQAANEETQEEEEAAAAAAAAAAELGGVHKRRHRKLLEKRAAHKAKMKAKVKAQTVGKGKMKAKKGKVVGKGKIKGAGKRHRADDYAVNDDGDEEEEEEGEDGKEEEGEDDDDDDDDDDDEFNSSDFDEEDSDALWVDSCQVADQEDEEFDDVGT